MRLARCCAVIVFALAVCGCVRQSPEQRLVGRWGGDTVMSNGQTSAAHARITVSIERGGTFSASERIDGVADPLVVSGSWNLEGDGRTVDMHAQEALLGATFTLDGDRLSSTGGAEALTLAKIHWWQKR